MAINFNERTAQKVVSRALSAGMIIVGDSGTGKSRLVALSGERPLIVSYERQGLNTVLEWNPDAIIISVFEDDADGTWTGTPFGPITDPKTRNTITAAIMEAIVAGRPITDEDGKRWWRIPGIDFDREKSLVRFIPDAGVDIDAFSIDSFSEWCSIEFERQLGWHVADDFDDGNIPVTVYNRVHHNIKSMFRRLRELPVPWLMICLSDERDKDDKSTKAYPMLVGKKIAPVVNQYANAVGYLKKRMTSDGIEFGCYFELPSDAAITKSCSGLAPYEPLPADPSVNSPALWFKRMLSASPGIDPIIPEQVKDKLKEVKIDDGLPQKAIQPADADAGIRPARRRRGQ